MENNLHLNELEIAQAVEKMLDNDYLLSEALAHHLEECFACKAEVMKHYDAYKLVEGDIKIKRQASSSMGMYYRVAAALIVIILSSLLIYYLFLVDKNPDNIAKKEIKTPVIQDKENQIKPDSVVKCPVKNENEKPDLLAFAVSNNYESLIKNNVRSTGVKVITPKINAEFKIAQPIVFSFKSMDKTDYTLIVLDNKENELSIIPLSAESYSYSKKLKPGLYYWKLETADALICIGKFMVKN